jgi:hypothetical protein
MRLVAGLVVPLVVLLTSVARGSPAQVIEGRVIDAHARWTSDGSRIVTEATVRTPDRDVVVSQLGGTVGALTMQTFPGPEILAVGMRVAVAVHEAHDLERRAHLVVDSARVLELPPGFVRTGPTRRGNYLYWESGCVIVTPDAAGTGQVVGNREFEAIASSVEEWNREVAGCSYMRIELAPPIEAEVGRDGINLIKFRDVTWCRPAIKDDPPRCHSPSAAGLTTAVFVDDPDSDRDGAIVDADIELNGQHFAITHEGQTTGRAPCRSEITNTLTHELGHLLGLEHPCRTAGDPLRFDHEGNEVPLCSQTSDPEITEATMYNFQECGETKKASLSADEVNAICSIYPIANDPGVCAPVDLTRGGCCDASDRGPPALLVIGLVAMLGRRRQISSRSG